MRFATIFLGLLWLVSCRDAPHGVRIQYFGKYEFTTAERKTIERIASSTATEVRKHLPGLAQQITIRVESGKEVIPEFGALGSAIPPDWVMWRVDADRPEGVLKIAETQLRATLFHEFHHLVRGNPSAANTVMEHVVTEGLATAFERDFAGTSPPWSHYPANVQQWVDELIALPPSAQLNDWMWRTPDGRRWVGMRAGTYLVDRAMKKLNRTSADLVATPFIEIVTAGSDSR